MLTPTQWQAFKDVVNNAAESFNQSTVTWYRLTEGIDRWKEDDKAEITYTPISISCLMSYNVFRTWPMTDGTPSGELDQESVTMMLNKKQLEDAGYLNSDGFFDFDPGMDYFVHLGLKYRSAGETPVSQAGDEHLHFYIILKRDETPTGTKKY